MTIRTAYILAIAALFISMIVWVFRKKRKARFDRDAQIPLHKEPVELNQDKPEP